MTQEITELVSEFDAIAADLQYQQATQTVQQLLDQLDLSARERAGLGQELQGLAKLRNKLAHKVIHIAVFGLVGRGKSSILNALIGQPVFQTGPLHGVTQQVESIAWQIDRLSEQTALYRASLPGTNGSRVELVDTPGIDEVDGQDRQQMAQTVAQQADLILFVVAGDLTQVEYDALAQIRQASKPVLLVFNKADHYSTADRQLILAKLQQQVEPLQIQPDEIIPTAAAPLIAQVVQQGERRQVQRQRGPAQVDALKLKILDTLHRDGKALIALNTLLYADSLNQRIVARKLEIRAQSAEDTIWQLALAKAVAVAVNPVLVADLIGGAAVDLTLILTLSRLYGLEMTQQGALSLLKTMAVAMGGLSASELLATVGLSSLKSFLGVSTALTGGLAAAPYLSAAIAQAAVAGVSTYMIGQIAKTYLANGASWGAQGPKAAIADILATVDERSILARLRADLKQRLNLPSD
ncbi:MAG: DUF697 domain-containing protein [Leptolyngbya sp. SIO4C1]|nr:DUF697 domain-containing protein [Leptolyngbya sp. SIO4C1]